jgi:hypothetical protein
MQYLAASSLEQSMQLLERVRLDGGLKKNLKTK